MSTTTTNTGTTKTTTNNATSQPNTAAAQACCQGATDAFKTSVDASQKMFNTFKNMFNMDAFSAPFTSATNTMPATFEKMTKTMNSFVDANARFVTECSALTVDAMRTNARMIERTGDMVVSNLSGKNSKPVTETSREIFDEACAFTAKTGERVVKMNTEHGQTMTQTLTNNWVQLADTFVSQNGTAKSCCNG